MGKKFRPEEILRYTGSRVHSATLRRAYLSWRSERGIAERCDNPECIFHEQPLAWNGRRLPLILDHLEGVNGDNRPEKLRLLCPNCDSQLDTRAGKNKKRVEQSDGGFAFVDRETGKRTYFMPVEAGHYTIGWKEEPPSRRKR